MRVTCCSVSDRYVAYSVVEENDQVILDGPPELALDSNEQAVAKQTLIVVIDVKNLTEIVLENPSNRRVTAIYADEGLLMVGSHDSAYYLTPSKLFLSEADLSNVFTEVKLPESHRQKSEIYAFWHTKNQAKVDIFVKSTVKTEICIF